MPNKASYGQLSTEDKIKVNAAIIDALEKDVDGFAKSFMQAVSKQPHKEQKDKFQTVLDGVRDQLAMQVDSLPRVTKNDLSVETNLREQSVQLRSVSGFGSSRMISDALKQQREHVIVNDNNHKRIHMDVPGAEMPKVLDILNKSLSSGVSALDAGQKMADAGVAISSTSALSNIPAKASERQIG